MVTDSDYMSIALTLAERGRGQTSPNPMVGAIVVDAEGVIVGRGWHEFAGGPHAEVHALRNAGSRSRGATLYCTLEPCCHTGRTGPCAPEIADAGVRRVVVAIQDPNPLVAGKGIQHLKAKGLEVSVGVRQEEAAELNRPFFTRIARRRPFVTAKVALSLDARVAGAGGVPIALTGEAANRLVHRERAEIDAIAVGSGTILADDPLLTARGIYRSRPLVRAVFDGRLRTPATSKLLSTLDAGPVIIVTTASSVSERPNAAAALQEAGARLQIHETAPGERLRLAAAMEKLAADGVMSLVIEGGPSLHRAAWEEQIVDRVQVFVTPRIVGTDGIPWASVDAFPLVGLTNTRAVPLDDDVLIEGYVHRAD
jgi:diaminohydroxyphosphoribosylaminopyrimidine deaminase / 5-amino-6-(5-phosphoribosylamino)uracil reductase